MAFYRENPPEANVLMGSMRSMGYTFNSAIADILDNSISANAKNILISFPIEAYNCYISILDDGDGMTSEELYEAMKYGSSIEGDRKETDLGRFGLGLKSASLSQCRKLTVASKKNNIVSAFVWDLDLIDKEKNWIIQELEKSEWLSIIDIGKLLSQSKGTLVIWQEFDVIEKSTGEVFTSLINKRNELSNYLSLIFHRFISGEQVKKVKIIIDNYDLKSLDPFLEKHNKTNHRQEIKVAINDSKGKEQHVIVKPYILPFQKDMSDEDFQRMGGIENYRTKQGFYIYRNARLIIWGTWFGQPKNELTKNARVKVDIPNTLDDIWEIDIKKQNATIPLKIRQNLKRAVNEAMDISVKTQVYRGRIENIDENLEYIWDRLSERNGKFIYKINRNSKIFQLLKDEEDDFTWNAFEMILEEIESGIPYQQIYIDMSNHKIDEDLDVERLKNIEDKAKLLIDYAVKTGQERNQAVEVLFLTEPFCKYIDLKNKMIKEIKSGN